MSGRNCFSAWMKAALARAALPTAIRLYDLCHIAASLLYAQGVRPLQIADILGHSDPNFTLRTYTHTWEELHHEAADKMAQCSSRPGRSSRMG